MHWWGIEPRPSLMNPTLNCRYELGGCTLQPALVLSFGAGLAVPTGNRTPSTLADDKLCEGRIKRVGTPRTTCAFSLLPSGGLDIYIVKLTSTSSISPVSGTDFGFNCITADLL